MSKERLYPSPEDGDSSQIKREGALTAATFGQILRLGAEFTRDGQDITVGSLTETYFRDSTDIDEKVVVAKQKYHYNPPYKRSAIREVRVLTFTEAGGMSDVHPLTGMRTITQLSLTFTSTLPVVEGLPDQNTSADVTIFGDDDYSLMYSAKVVKKSTTSPEALAEVEDTLEEWGVPAVKRDVSAKYKSLSMRGNANLNVIDGYYDERRGQQFLRMLDQHLKTISRETEQQKSDKEEN